MGFRDRIMIEREEQDEDDKVAPVTEIDVGVCTPETCGGPGDEGKIFIAIPRNIMDVMTDDTQRYYVAMLSDKETRRLIALLYDGLRRK